MREREREKRAEGQFRRHKITRMSKKIRRRRREEEKKKQSNPCRFGHVGTEGSPAGSQSNKVVRGCFAGCKFSPCGLSVSTLLLPLFPLSLYNCELNLCTSFRDTRKWPCSRSPIHNPLCPPVSSSRLILSPDYLFWPFPIPSEESLSHGIYTVITFIRNGQVSLWYLRKCTLSVIWFIRFVFICDENIL